MKSEIYNRTKDLINKYISFLESAENKNIQKNITIENFFYLKTVLSNINNVITLLATLTIAKKLTTVFAFTEKEKEQIISNIENKKANSNGFDIQIENPKKILIEVKCNIPINEKKLGQAQINGILEDARKLRKESSKHKKIKIDTSDYMKVIGIVNSKPELLNKILYQITKEVKCKNTTNPERIERFKIKPFIRPLKNILELKNITDLSYVYIVPISISDLEKELQYIKHDITK